MPDWDVSDSGLCVTEPPPDWGIRQVWADPSSIAPNSGNPKVHPVQQTEELARFLAEHGWIQPLLYNARLRRLVDGHDRLEVALSRGFRSVPVWVGSWDEGQEASVVAALSENQNLARYDPRRTREWLAILEVKKPDLKGLVDRIRSREMLSRNEPAPNRSGSQGGRDDARSDTAKSGPPQEPQDPRAAALAEEPEALRASRVRLVQLILDQRQLRNWEEWMAILTDHLGIQSVTDVVLKVVMDAYTRALRDGAGKKARR